MLKKNRFYQPWDPRVFDRWIQYGLRDLPTALHPLEAGSPLSSSSSSTTTTTSESEPLPPVTLTTTVPQEVFTFARPSYSAKNPIDKRTHPDLDYNWTGGQPFYRSETHITAALLPYVRPSVFYIFGDKSDISHPLLRAEKMSTTGTGAGGSGGAREGRVHSVTLGGVSHCIPMEAVNITADHIGNWLKSEMQRWYQDEDNFKREWNKKSRVEKATVDEEWKKQVAGFVQGRKKRSSPKL